MAEQQLPRPNERPGVGAETIPPGATRQAEERPVTPPRGDPNEDAVTERTIDNPKKGEKARRPRKKGRSS